MSDRLDRALAVIDVGLQRAGDVAYGSDNGLCIRCQARPPAEGSSWCAGPCTDADDAGAFRAAALLGSIGVTAAEAAERFRTALAATEAAIERPSVLATLLAWVPEPFDPAAARKITSSIDRRAEAPIFYWPDPSPFQGRFTEWRTPEDVVKSWPRPAAEPDPRVTDPTNILSWGAVSDGVTDCGPALRACATAAGEVHFPPGTYRISPGPSATIARAAGACSR